MGPPGTMGTQQLSPGLRHLETEPKEVSEELGAKMCRWDDVNVYGTCPQTSHQVHPLLVSTTSWCLPSTSTRIKSRAAAAADLQYPLRRSLGWKAEMKHSVLGGKTGRPVLQILIFSGDNFMGPILASPYF